MAKVAIAVFPGSNCERDVQTVLDKVYKFQPELVWHTKSNLRNYDAIIIPGGFSYGDRLRAGAIAAHSPIIKEIKRLAKEAFLFWEYVMDFKFWQKPDFFQVR
jgi:phosphoribosylformylglycinamidine (FGAM) synthase-like amidotransferase family enzyme